MDGTALFVSRKQFQKNDGATCGCCWWCILSVSQLNLRGKQWKENDSCSTWRMTILMLLDCINKRKFDMNAKWVIYFHYHRAVPQVFSPNSRLLWHVVKRYSNPIESKLTGHWLFQNLACLPTKQWQKLLFGLNDFNKFYSGNLNKPHPTPS